MNWIEQILNKLRTLSGKRAYGPIAAGVLALDYVVPFFPSTTLVIASGFLQPRRWLQNGTWLVFGSAAGAVLVTLLIQWVAWILPGDWNEVPDWILQYGGWGLFFLACLPTPIRTGTIACALIGIDWPFIFLAVLSGRLISYGTLLFIGSRFPHWLIRWPGMKRFFDPSNDT